MNLNAVKIWEIAGGVLALTGAVVLTARLMRRKRPTAAEIELGRRQYLTQNGRIVDGTLLDVAEVPGEDGHSLTMLMYDYRIGGVDYQASQDITLMGDVVTVAHVRSGFPCSVRYQPSNPENSIVVAESWSGLRKTIPVLTWLEEGGQSHPHLTTTREPPEVS
ncbi:MAG TPA: DUF3592 domain-containing protein [Terracidiphilus sp.]|jgi:hypothetical protein